MKLGDITKNDNVLVAFGVNEPPSEVNPQTLCSNWREGCNGVTDGPEDGRLTLCDECANEQQSK